MGSATATKARSAILDWTAAGIASAAYEVGSVIDVSAMIGNANVLIHMGRNTGTAFAVAAPPRIDIQGSDYSSGTDKWVPIASYPFSAGASISVTTLSGAATAGDTTVSVTSATGLAADQLLFLGHTSDPTKYEVVRIKSVSGTTVTLVEPIGQDHDSGAEVTNNADFQSIPIALEGWLRVRAIAVCDNQGGTGQKYYVRVALAATTAIAYA